MLSLSIGSAASKAAVASSRDKGPASRALCEAVRVHMALDTPREAALRLTLRRLRSCGAPERRRIAALARADMDFLK